MIIKDVVNSLKLFLKAHRHSLLIKEVKVDEHGFSSAVIQVIGKPVFFTKKVKEIVNDESLLRQFPLEQIKALVSLSCHEKDNIPVYRLSAIDHEANELIIKEVSTGKFFVLSPTEASQPYILELFTKEDVYRMGVECSENERRLDDERIRLMKQPKLSIVKSYPC